MYLDVPSSPHKLTLSDVPFQLVMGQFIPRSEGI